MVVEYDLVQHPRPRQKHPSATLIRRSSSRVVQRHATAGRRVPDAGATPWACLARLPARTCSGAPFRLATGRGQSTARWRHWLLGQRPLASVHSGSEQGGPPRVRDRLGTLTGLKVTEVPISVTHVSTARTVFPGCATGGSHVQTCQACYGGPPEPGSGLCGCVADHRAALVSAR